MRSASGFQVKWAMIGAAACVLISAVGLAAQSQQTFKGEICLQAAEQASPPEEQSPEQCSTTSEKRAKYVLSSAEGNAVYQLDDQRKFKTWLGEKVVVSGTLDSATATIHVTDVMRAPSSKLIEARSVYIDCSACPRALAGAWWAAFQSLTEWGRFDVVPDPQKADLIFLFSANRYLGDYLTRDGPDLRPVYIETTFLDIIDPGTGKSLWGDTRRYGSWFVADATRDLIVEFKQQLAVGETQNERLLFLMDSDKDGKISKQEFLKYMDAEFDRLDVNKDGELDAEELKQLRVVSVGK